jgi:hypothetical protein
LKGNEIKRDSFHIVDEKSRKINKIITIGVGKENENK